MTHKPNDTVAHRPSHGRVRLYHELRSAHLERAANMAPSTWIYYRNTYDFHDALRQGFDVRQLSTIKLVKFLGTATFTVIEVNEPLYYSALPRTALTIAIVRLRDRLKGTRCSVVTYAIENSPPVAGRSLRERAQIALAKYVWARLDKVAFGTDQAKDVYLKTFAKGRRPEARLFLALPAPRPEANAAPVRPHQAIFLGSFERRKGIDLLLDAWPSVASELPSAKLYVLGKGPLIDSVRSVQKVDQSITLVVDPTRSAIFNLLAGSHLLILPSRPAPGWREQLGLPILEALSCGCEIVTTSETGLAPWLVQHGHAVIDSEDLDTSTLSHAILTALQRARSRSQITDSLPTKDGRLQADDWMMSS